MKKKITAMIFALILCLCAVTPAFAANSDGFVGECNRLNDAANLLTDCEEAELLAKLDEISLRQQMDVTVATVTIWATATPPPNAPMRSMNSAASATVRARTV